MSYLDTTPRRRQCPATSTPLLDSIIRHEVVDSRQYDILVKENERLACRVRDLEEELEVLKWERLQADEELMTGSMGSEPWAAAGGDDEGDQSVEMVVIEDQENSKRQVDARDMINDEDRPIRGGRRKRRLSGSREDSPKAKKQRSILVGKLSSYLPTPVSYASSSALRSESKMRAWESDSNSGTSTPSKGFWKTFGLEVQAPRTTRASARSTSKSYRSSNTKYTDMIKNEKSRDDWFAPRVKTLTDEDTEESLIILNLPHDFTRSNLADLFGTFNFTFRSSSLVPIVEGGPRLRQAASRGFCFVEMEDERQRDRAVRVMDGMLVDGKKVAVKVAKRATYSYPARSNTGRGQVPAAAGGRSDRQRSYV
ncbi:hypothetical protein IAR50_002568 [Cryptococcus sp. DSM 104548]